GEVHVGEEVAVAVEDRHTPSHEELELAVVGVVHPGFGGDEPVGGWPLRLGGGVAPNQVGGPPGGAGGEGDAGAHARHHGRQGARTARARGMHPRSPTCRLSGRGGQSGPRRTERGSRWRRCAGGCWGWRTSPPPK